MKVHPGFVRRFAAGMAVIVGTVLMAFVTNVGGLRSRFGGPAGPIRALVVLPFENVPGSADLEYLADGLTDTLIGDLAQLSGTRIIGRDTARAYLGSTKPLEEIARELSVDAVVKASIQKSGQSLSLKAELVHVGASASRSVWARTYERGVREGPALQVEMAHDVLNAVDALGSTDETVRLKGRKPGDPAVTDLFFKGLSRLRRGSKDDLDAALAFFEQALALDQSYAPAWAAVAEAHLARARTETLAQLMSKAKAAAERAVALDGNLAAAHRTLGLVHVQWAWDWPRAEAALRRALELAPGDAETHAAQALFLSATARLDTAVVEIWEAQQSDPLSFQINLDAGWINFEARRFDQAIADFGRAASLDPRSGIAQAGVAVSLGHAGRAAEALRAAEQAVDRDQSPSVLEMVAGVYARDGQRTMARSLERLAAEAHGCELEVAVIHVALKELNEAFRWLERGLTERRACMLRLRTDIRLDPIRTDRRYTDLVERMGFSR